MRKNILIIGAGPAGLTAGYELSKEGLRVTILEEDPKTIGGLARTLNFKGNLFDIGPHRFFSKNKEINLWWKNILGEDLLRCPRLTRWYYQNKFFNYPINPFEIVTVFGPFYSIRIILSYLRAKIFPAKPEINLSDWCINNFGYFLAKPFFIDYNLKLWGVSPEKLSKDFASQRVKGISLLDVFLDYFKKFLKPKSETPKSLIEEFNYPKYGSGMMWKKTASLIIKQNGKILMGHKVITINHKNGRIVSVLALNKKKYKKYTPDYVLSTMPLSELILSLKPAPPREIIEAADFLDFRDIINVTLIINKKMPLLDNWLYIHGKNMIPIRMTIYKNFSSLMNPDKNKTSVGFEYTCSRNDSFWKETTKELINQATEDVEKLGFAKKDEVIDGAVIKLKNAYPRYLLGYDKRVKKIKKYLLSSFKKYSLQPIGRGGLHRYNNMDHSMMTAILAVKNILNQGSFDQWKVNTDAEYHEKSS